MQIAGDQTVAVLTGDLVESSQLSTPARRRVHQAFSEISTELRDQFAVTVPYEIDVFRGDSWQMLVVHPEVALRIGLYVRSSLRARLQSNRVDTRFAVGVGTVTFIPSDGVSGGDGPAFRQSGQLLEGMARHHRMGFAGPEVEEAFALDTVLKLLDYPATWWTWRQAQAISGALVDRTQEEIAEDWPEDPISQQAVAQHLSRAGWHAVDTALAFFEQTVNRCLGG